MSVHIHRVGWQEIQRVACSGAPELNPQWEYFILAL